MHLIVLSILVAYLVGVFVVTIILRSYVMQIPIDSQGRYYPLFIKNRENITEYRYRDIIK